MRRWVVVAGLLALAVLAGDKSSGTPCGADDECQRGFVCEFSEGHQRRECLIGCRRDEDCQAKEDARGKYARCLPSRWNASRRECWIPLLPFSAR